MTDYRLPEDMTVEQLRELAGLMRADDWADCWPEIVDAWADAIDPPEPESVVTDEMVEAFAIERYGYVSTGHIDLSRSVLKAAVKCGWTPPQELSQEGGPTASSSEAVAPDSQASGEAENGNDSETESECLSPPPTSVVTYEMIDAVADEVGWGDVEQVLLAVERLGWLRDPNGIDWEEACSRAWSEIRRLRSLDGEGDSDD